MIVDSCLDPSTKQPVSLLYLEKLGVDVVAAVKVVLVTHWHDDHIRGLSTVVEKCKSARVCYSAALLKQEFLSLVST
jgi:glyoxylase-like metal-dependent hydrolase (beta-lactamase superfamily II)